MLHIILRGRAGRARTIRAAIYHIQIFLLIKCIIINHIRISDCENQRYPADIFLFQILGCKITTAVSNNLIFHSFRLSILSELLYVVFNTTYDSMSKHELQPILIRIHKFFMIYKIFIFYLPFSNCIFIPFIV